MSSDKQSEPKISVGKLPDAPQPKDGWNPVGKAFEGRKKPDGLGEHWQ